MPKIVKKVELLKTPQNHHLGVFLGFVEKVEEIINQYSDNQLDLIVLPEFFSTGICDKSFIDAPEDENGGV